MAWPPRWKRCSEFLANAPSKGKFRHCRKITVRFRGREEQPDVESECLVAGHGIHTGRPTGHHGRPGRIKSIHLKDWGKGEGRGYSVAFGEGDVPWKPLLEAAESVGGIEYYLIEQEIAGPAGEFAMAQRCLDNYKKLRG